MATTFTFFLSPIPNRALFYPVLIMIWQLDKASSLLIKILRIKYWEPCKRYSL
jgi:hypothetical protein